MPNPTAAYDPAAAPWVAVLTATQTTAALQAGWADLEGPLLAAESVAGRLPHEVREMAGIAADRPFVDIVTVAPDRLLRLADGAVERTRMPTGSCLVRIDPDRTRRLLTYFDGPAYGWRNGRGFADPSTSPGPTAVYHGLTCAAAGVPGDDDVVELVIAAHEPPEGFAWSRPGVCRAVIALAGLDSPPR